MKRITTLAFLFLSLNTLAQQAPDWGKWTRLIGEWKGEGNGKPGQGSGTFTIKPDLDKRILVRKAHSEYPAKDGGKATVHDDMLIVYPDNTGTPTKAIYFDNEGHTISYSVVYNGNLIIMTSEKIPNMPVFRLTYVILDDKTVDTKFEMSQDGDSFMTYVQGTSKKVK